MKEQEKQNNQNQVFESKDTKKLFHKGLKYLAIALPLLFASPIVITIGFKALNKGNGYLIIVVGCILAFFTIALVTQAFRLILKSLFNK